MKKITFVLLASTMMLLANDAATKTEHLHWGYTGHNTPDKWGSLSEKYRECGVGLNQSPINITHSLHANLPLLPHPIKVILQRSLIMDILYRSILLLEVP